MDANAEQSLPKPVDAASGEAVWDVILEDKDLPEWLRKDIIARDKMGLEKYGQRLRVHNDRDAILDAYQEAKDLWVYLKQAELRAVAEAGRHWPAGFSENRLVYGFMHQVALARTMVLWLGKLVQEGAGEKLK